MQIDPQFLNSSIPEILNFPPSSIHRWREPCGSLERRGEPALRAEAAFGGDAGERLPGCRDERCRARDAPLLDERARGDAGGRPERPREVEGTEAGAGGEVPQTDRLAKVGLDEQLDAPERCRREAAAKVRA